MKVSIYRFDPAVDDAGHIDTYELPLASNGEHSVMQILEYIYANLDATLRFFTHSACCQGICGRCAVKVNGKNVLACSHQIHEDDIRIEPATSKVLIDLVTQA